MLGCRPPEALDPEGRIDAEAWKHERSILNLVGKFLRLLPEPGR